ncbi:MULTISPECIES: FMN-dependent NADH-azoreductase [Pseudomonas aeruginosa group]|uniref:FMN dependent NADH:quinone oxidoreductase n=1 Tax=Pseudomonas nitroreducens TaxID=46680 RepID=A0A6G6ISQ7_PSENT|nr:MULTISPECIES: NAD(P)H-dependent oxidoreductase [Pseudomonas aeruginosa group]KYO75092.1 FMN-dependent NADH-azoreductase [Pseudomonas aeruginosa]QIE85983.1 FMN-dependent NADH-azoreductase [Pseudomonas nitroreducens]HCE6396368.1 NAD(P)H-dependent oxidoreductase [Pseudomonas aeruginosa]
MPKLLHIQSSANLQNSVTRVLSEKFVETWSHNHSNVQVELLDLVANPLPHFGPEILQAGVLSQDQWTPEVRNAVELSDRLIKQLEAADILVIGAPMINFTICTQLKAWFDHVTIAGRTFKYSAPGASKGLLFGKKAFVIEARGGDYTDIPMNAFDFQEPLLRMLLGFIGIFDVSFIRAEGMRQRSEEFADIMRNAESVIARLAA